MYRICRLVCIIPITVSLLLFSCAYFNTFYNAERYYEEADRIRLEKSGKAIPLKAMDNYGKTIQKCRVVLSEFPESKLVNDAILLMAKHSFTDQSMMMPLEILKLFIVRVVHSKLQRHNIGPLFVNGKKGRPRLHLMSLKVL